MILMMIKADDAVAANCINVVIRISLLGAVIKFYASHVV